MSLPVACFPSFYAFWQLVQAVQFFLRAEPQRHEETGYTVNSLPPLWPHLTLLEAVCRPVMWRIILPIPISRRLFYDRAAELQQGQDISMLDVCILSVLRLWMLSKVVQSPGSLWKRNTFLCTACSPAVCHDICTGLHAFFQRKYVGVTIETVKTLAGTLSEVSRISAFTLTEFWWYNVRKVCQINYSLSMTIFFLIVNWGHTGRSSWQLRQKKLISERLHVCSFLKIKFWC